MAFLLLSFFLLLKKNIYFQLHWVFTVAYEFSLVAVSGGYSLVVGHGLLIAVAPLVLEHDSRLEGFSIFSTGDQQL